MNKAEITVRALMAGLLGAALAGVLVVFAENSVCYDVAIGTQCNSSLGLMVILGIPASVFLIIFAVVLRSIPDQSEYELRIKKEK